MTRTANSIKFTAAQTIFVDAKFERIEVAGQTVAYKARLDGAEYSDSTLTSLCQRLWELQRSKSS